MGQDLQLFDKYFNNLRQPTDEEKSIIAEAKNDALKLFKVDSESIIMKRSNSDPFLLYKYYKAINKILKKYGIIYFKKYMVKPQNINVEYTADKNALMKLFVEKRLKTSQRKFEKNASIGIPKQRSLKNMSLEQELLEKLLLYNDKVDGVLPIMYDGRLF